MAVRWRHGRVPELRRGEPPGVVHFERARDLFVECDARIYLPEVEVLLADTRS